VQKKMASALVGTTASGLLPLGQGTLRLQEMEQTGEGDPGALRAGVEQGAQGGHHGGEQAMIE
jgi:hypothetical protein